MALQASDMLAVYRLTDNTNYQTTVQDIVDRVPDQADPTLTSVLQASNIAQNVSIIIQNSGQDNVCVLGNNSDTPNSFALKTSFADEVSVGDAQNVLLQPAGAVIANEGGFIGSATNFGLRVYAAGTTVATVDDGSATAVATVKTDGSATFSGPLEAESIDGGVYATT